MIATLPAVQFNCKSARRMICISPNSIAKDKRYANRSHRRYLNAVTRSFINDPELFDEETFHAPTLSSWDLC